MLSFLGARGRLSINDLCLPITASQPVGHALLAITTWPYSGQTMEVLVFGISISSCRAIASGWSATLPLQD
jgi:hypothetical protein